MITPLVTDLVILILFFVFTKLVNTPAPLSVFLPFCAMYIQYRLLPCALGMDVTPTGLSSLRLLNRGMLSLA